MFPIISKDSLLMRCEVSMHHAGGGDKYLLIAFMHSWLMIRDTYQGVKGVVHQKGHKELAYNCCTLIVLWMPGI